MSRFEDDLRLVLPKTDVNGDTISLVPRADVLRRLHGLIWPIQNSMFRQVEHLGNDDPGARMSADEEMEAGRARTVIDLNTKEGQEAYLNCWWPKDADGACIALTAPLGKEAELPYPIYTQLRSASITLRLTPTLVFGTMRFGVAPVTTTQGRAFWDIGIRRAMFHPTPAYYAWLQANGATSRLTPLEPDDPLRTWTHQPGLTTKVALAFYIELPDRHITDDRMAWMKGMP